jgi:hypothetical protein
MSIFQPVFDALGLIVMIFPPLVLIPMGVIYKPLWVAGAGLAGAAFAWLATRRKDMQGTRAYFAVAIGLLVSLLASCGAGGHQVYAEFSLSSTCSDRILESRRIFESAMPDGKIAASLALARAEPACPRAEEQMWRIFTIATDVKLGAQDIALARQELRKYSPDYKLCGAMAAQIMIVELEAKGMPFVVETLNLWKTEPIGGMCPALYKLGEWVENRCLPQGTQCTLLLPIDSMKHHLKHGNDKRWLERTLEKLGQAEPKCPEGDVPPQFGQVRSAKTGCLIKLN